MDDQDYDQPTGKKPTQVTPTVSPQTRAHYLKVVNRRRRHIAEQNGIDDYQKVLADTVIDDLIARAGTLKKNSIRLYRAAIRDWISENRVLSAKEAQRLLARLDDTKGEMPGSGEKAERRELKGIAYEDWTLIKQQIEQAEPGFEYIAGQVLLASIHTGMRPIEWQTAKFTGESVEALLDMGYQWPRLLRGDLKPWQIVPVMLIQNAKHTNGRGGDGIRYVPVPPEAFEPIRRVLAHIREYQTKPSMFGNGKYESWLRLVRDGCAKIMKKAFPRRKNHYTVYNCRHQFAAELKACDLSKEVVAELMGHSSEETAGAHYARKKSAWKLSPMFREGEPGPPSFVPKKPQGDHCMPTL